MPAVGLAEGVELAGAFTGSGYREPPHLVFRGDGQVVRLPALLYLVVQAFDHQRQTGRPGGPTALAEAATTVARATGREITAGHIAYLCDRKLAPLGVTTYSDGSAPTVARANPFLSLRLRTAVLPPTASWRIGGVFRWLYYPPAMALMLAVAAAAEVWVARTGDTGAALARTIASPAGVLVVVGLAVASAAFHECGHATACRYGGVAPGAMGCGVYLVWPAFYTDITATYRLGRAGRLRADLGGVYFNALFLAVLTAAYAATGYAPLLAGVLAINIEIVEQLLPTLRFDGYYIVADLVGIPDLFKYIGPILARAVLRRPADRRLQALKRWPQLIVTIWVLSVVPMLSIELGYLTFQLPQLVHADTAAIGQLAATVTTSASPFLTATSAAVQIVLLLLPVAGVIVIITRLARAPLRAACRRIPLPRPRAARRPRLAIGVAVAVAVAVTTLAACAGLALALSLPAPAHRHPAIAAPAQPPQPGDTAPRAILAPASPAKGQPPRTTPARQERKTWPTPAAGDATSPAPTAPGQPPATAPGIPPATPAPASTPAPVSRPLAAGLPSSSPAAAIPSGAAPSTAQTASPVPSSVSAASQGPPPPETEAMPPSCTVLLVTPLGQIGVLCP